MLYFYYIFIIKVNITNTEKIKNNRLNKNKKKIKIIINKNSNITSIIYLSDYLPIIKRLILGEDILYSTQILKEYILDKLI